jgi:hypothetical protein
MGAKLTAEAIDLAGNIFITCQMFPAAKTIRGAKAGDDILEIFAHNVGLDIATRLSNYAGNELTAEAVLRYFGTLPHYQRIEMGTTTGRWLPGTPKEIRPFFHLALPLSDGVYINEGIKLHLHGLMQLGEPDGPQVTHLGAVFSAHVSQEVLDSILEEQASEMKVAIGVLSEYGEFDFSEYAAQFERLRRGINRFGL